MAKGTSPKTKRNQKILELKDKKKMTMENIAKMMQISKARVWQIYHREIDKGNNPYLFFNIKKRNKKRKKSKGT